MNTAAQEVSQPLTVFKKLKFLEIFIDEENQCIYANWKGIPSVEEVKTGVEMVLEAMVNYQLFTVLNDNRELQGTWTGAMEWIVNDWMPRAIEAGYKGIAYIYSKDVFARFSVDSLLKQTVEKGPVKQKPFKDIEEAKNWLKTI